MKILVPLKRVADPANANKVKVSGDGSAITTEGLEWKINPYDEYALEAALRLAEDGSTKKRIDGSEVVVVSIGPGDTDQTLRQALAMGADRAILVDGEDTALDTESVSNILKTVIENESPNFVLMGKIAVDVESNAVGGYLAELLGWPMAAHANTIVTDNGGESFTIGREVDGGVLTMKIESPCIITASDRSILPEAVKNGVTPADHKYPEAEGGRYASLKGIMAAKKKPIDKTSVSDLGVETESHTTFLGYTLPPARSGSTTFVETVEELVTKLHSDAKVL